MHFLEPIKTTRDETDDFKLLEISSSNKCEDKLSDSEDLVFQ